MRYLKRIIAFPFLLPVAIISAVFGVAEWAARFLLYGSEFLTHGKDDRKMIADLYGELKRKNDLLQQFKDDSDDN